MDNKWTKMASRETVDKIIVKLKENNIEAEFLMTGEEAKKKILELIPQGEEVLAMTSKTLDAIGITKEIEESGKYISIKKKYFALDMKTQMNEVKKLRSLPEWALGSVHAVTFNGEVLAASATGNQISAYAYGANHVVWVIGVQKIVENIDEGIKRIYEHSLPLESERLKKAMGVPSSSVNRILIFNKESARNIGRTKIFFVNEALGF